MILRIRDRNGARGLSGLRLPQSQTGPGRIHDDAEPAHVLHFGDIFDYRCAQGLRLLRGGAFAVSPDGKHLMFGLSGQVYRLSPESK